MDLDKFLEKFLENIIDTRRGLDNIKATIKSNMIEKNYDTTKVECQIYTEEHNYEPKVEITSDGYDDGEVIFIDFHLDEEIKE